MWEPKPHVVGVVTSLVFIASVSTAADRMAERDGPSQVTIEDLAAPGDDPSAEPTPRGAGGLVNEADRMALPAGPGAADDDPAAQPSQQPTEDGGSPTDDPTSPGGSGPGGGGGGTPGSKPTYPEASLYSDSEKVRGITDEQIVLCGHAALALGAAFDTSREDLNVYWDMVNDAGGVIGRDVVMSWEDDAYVSDVAVRAATACADKDPFMILGGIGFDQIPGVRTWAESNQELYLHHIALAPEKTYDYSYSLSPTVELTGEEFGNYIVREHADAKIGVMYRDTDNWKPGSDAGIEVMEARDMSVGRYAVFQNQGVYSQQLNQMQMDGVEVVWIWENALNAAQIINQAEEMEYRPTWVVFPFQTTLDILTDPDRHTIEGVAAWSSYAPGGYGGAHSQFGVDAEIARFEAAYAKYRPDTKPNDILWQVWVGSKILHRMFEDCGSDCNRNRFAGMMLSGYKAKELPGCQVDFSDPRSFGGHHGGFGFFTQKQFFPSTGPAYQTIDYCATTLKR